MSLFFFYQKNFRFTKDLSRKLLDDSKIELSEDLIEVLESLRPIVSKDLQVSAKDDEDAMDVEENNVFCLKNSEITMIHAVGSIISKIGPICSSNIQFSKQLLIDLIEKGYFEQTSNNFIFPTEEFNQFEQEMHQNSSENTFSLEKLRKWNRAKQILEEDDQKLAFLQVLYEDFLPSMKNLLFDHFSGALEFGSAKNIEIISSFFNGNIEHKVRPFNFFNFLSKFLILLAFFLKVRKFCN